METENKKYQNNTTRYLEFHLGAESYAVELLTVKEVITIPELTPIPKSAAHVSGIMNLRGQVITVIDLRKKLGIPAAQDNSQCGVIIFDLKDKCLGVMVDSIHKVLTISAENVKQIPDGDGANSHYYLGVLQHDSKLTMWLDPFVLLEPKLHEVKKAA